MGAKEWLALLIVALVAWIGVSSLRTDEGRESYCRYKVDPFICHDTEAWWK